MDRFESWVAQTTSQHIRVRDASLDQLLAEVRAGGQAALGQIVRRFGPQLEARIARLGTDAAERASDIMHDVLLRLPDTLHGYREEGRFEQWLYSQAFNRWRTMRRSIRRDRLVPTTSVPEPVVTASAAIQALDFEQLRARAEALLSESEREAWVLAVEGFSRQEIAAMLGVTPNAAGVRLDRAKKRLRDMLSRYLEPPSADAS
jgi:RNA polymerase sigma-70 factor, ECF subfamily